MNLLRQRLVALELGNTLPRGAAGGDLLLPAMVEAGLEVPVLVLTTSQGAHRWQRLNRSGVSIIAAPESLSTTPTSAAAVWKLYRARVRWARGELAQLLRPGDVVYSSTDVLPDVEPAWAFADRYPWIARSHHTVAPPWKRTGNPARNVSAWWLQRRLHERMRERARITLALNSDVAQWLERRGFSHKRVEVLPGGVDIQAAQRYKPESSTPHFDGVFLGRIHPAKGVFDLPAIWAAVIRQVPGARLGVIGDGDPQTVAHLRQAFANAGITGSVTLTGFLPDAERWRTLNAAKVFLFTDHEAGFGLALLEGMACGLPAVTYYLAYLSGVVQHGYRSVPQEKPDVFGATVADLLTDERSRRALGEGSKAEATRHAWSKVAIHLQTIVANLKL